MYYQEEQPILGILNDFESVNNSSKSLFDQLKEITESYNVVERFICKIENDSEYLKLVANHSYHHSNGFDKLVIDSLNEFGLKLRLHVWQDKSKEVEHSDIHNHSWNYASLVLNGSYRTILYTKSKLGKVYNKRRMPTLKNPTQFKNSKDETDRLIIINESTFMKGSIHYLHKDVLHKIIDPSSMTFTLVLQGEHVGGKSEVYNSDKIIYERNVLPTYFSTKDIVKLKDKVKNVTNNV